MVSNLYICKDGVVEATIHSIPSNLPTCHTCNIQSSSHCHTCCIYCGGDNNSFDVMLQGEFDGGVAPALKLTDVSH